MNRSLLGFALVLAAGTSAIAVVAQTQEVDLSWKPRVGAVSTYRLTSNSSFDIPGQGPTDIKFSIKIKNVIKAINGELVTLESAMDEMKMSMGGQEMAPPGQDNGSMSGTATRVVKLNGEFVSVETKGGGMPSSPRMEQMNTFFRPTGKVKIGDSWDHEIKADAKKGFVEAKARYTLVGPEKMGKRAVWKITFIYAEMVGQKPTSATGTIWIDQADGEMVRYAADYQDVSFAQGMPPVNASSVMERID